MRSSVKANVVAFGVAVAALMAVGFATASDAIPGIPKASATATLRHEPGPLSQARTDCSPDTG
jgi:hypothetical protein